MQQRLSKVVATATRKMEYAIPQLQTQHSINVILLLAHHLRRWRNIKSTWVQCLVFAGPPVWS